MENEEINILTSELTPEEIASYEEHAATLARKYNVSKVHVYVGLIEDTNERVVGYMKEPTYLQKMFALDKMSSVGPFASGEELRDAITLKEESDPRTQDEDRFKLGMAGACVAAIKIINNSFKKK